MELPPQIYKRVKELIEQKSVKELLKESIEKFVAEAVKERLEEVERQS